MSYYNFKYAIQPQAHNMRISTQLIQNPSNYFPENNQYEKKESMVYSEYESVNDSSFLSEFNSSVKTLNDPINGTTKKIEEVNKPVRTVLQKIENTKIVERENPPKTKTESIYKSKTINEKVNPLIRTVHNKIDNPGKIVERNPIVRSRHDEIIGTRPIEERNPIIRYEEVKNTNPSIYEPLINIKQSELPFKDRQNKNYSYDNFINSDSIFAPSFKNGINPEIVEPTIIKKQPELINQEIDSRGNIINYGNFSQSYVTEETDIKRTDNLNNYRGITYVSNDYDNYNRPLVIHNSPTRKSIRNSIFNSGRYVRLSNGVENINRTRPNVGLINYEQPYVGQVSNNIRTDIINNSGGVNYVTNDYNNIHRASAVRGNPTKKIVYGSRNSITHSSRNISGSTGIVENINITRPSVVSGNYITNNYYRNLVVKSNPSARSVYGSRHSISHSGINLPNSIVENINNTIPNIGLTNYVTNNYYTNNINRPLVVRSIPSNSSVYGLRNSITHSGRNLVEIETNRVPSSQISYCYQNDDPTIIQQPLGGNNYIRNNYVSHTNNDDIYNQNFIGMNPSEKYYDTIGNIRYVNDFLQGDNKPIPTMIQEEKIEANITPLKI